MKTKCSGKGFGFDGTTERNLGKVDARNITIFDLQKLWFKFKLYRQYEWRKVKRMFKLTFQFCQFIFGYLNGKKLKNLQQNKTEMKKS